MTQRLESCCQEEEWRCLITSSSRANNESKTTQKCHHETQSSVPEKTQIRSCEEEYSILSSRSGSDVNIHFKIKVK